MNWIGLPILPFILITVLGFGYVARRGPPVLAAVGTIPAFFAYAMWNSAGPSDYLGWVMSTHRYSVDQIVTLSNQLGDTAMAAVVGLFWVVVHILGMIIAAIALRRARILPLWAAILLALSQPVHLVAAILVVRGHFLIKLRVSLLPNTGEGTHVPAAAVLHRLLRALSTALARGARSGTRS